MSTRLHRSGSYQGNLPNWLLAMRTSVDTSLLTLFMLFPWPSKLSYYISGSFTTLRKKRHARLLDLDRSPHTMLGGIVYPDSGPAGSCQLPAAFLQCSSQLVKDSQLVNKKGRRWPPLPGPDLQAKLQSFVLLLLLPKVDHPVT